MAGSIARFLGADHERLETLLKRAFADPATVDLGAYREFREGLLRHIAMEEKILLPAVQGARGGEPLPAAAKLRLDHGALAALLVPTPTAAIGRAIRTILEQHNAVEEGPGGVYAMCEEILGAEAERVVEEMKGAPEVKTAPHVDGPHVMEAARRALARAGYEIDIG